MESGMEGCIVAGTTIDCGEDLAMKGPVSSLYNLSVRSIHVW